MYSKQWLLLGSISGFFAVVFGAFGAHFLKDKLSERFFLVYQTGVQYQMYHALALLALGLWAGLSTRVDTYYTGLSFILGTVIFSGSLYALALTEIRFLGAITPIGGVLFLIGWIQFALLVWKS